MIERALQGSRPSIARLISMVEDGGAEVGRVMDALYPHTGRAYSVGITGAPGAGKSTLTERLVARARADDLEVGVLAIDPSSPFSGGALLGDRVRMQSHATDPGVFIRSMATRGSMGGLAVHTAQACDLLDAAGFSRILIETVGVGQSELEVAQAADSTAVVLVPESGDGVQAMKAGLMEIGDLFVINKADREGADRAAFAVRAALELRTAGADWSPPVLMTAASTGDGVNDVVEQFEEHLEHLKRGGGLERRRRRRMEQRLHDLLRERLWGEFRARVPERQWEQSVDALMEHRLTPHQAAERLARLGPSTSGNGSNAKAPNRDLWSRSIRAWNSLQVRATSRSRCRFFKRTRGVSEVTAA